MGDPSICGECGYPFDDSEVGCHCGDICKICDGIIGETHGDETGCGCMDTKEAFKTDSAQWGSMLGPTADIRRSKPYNLFIKKKSEHHHGDGFEPLWIPDFLFQFQKHLVEWALKMGRSAIFADCGLGKTPMQLVWAQNVVEQTNKPVLILTPLAVSYQTERESQKFGIELARSRDGEINAKIVATNYERLTKFDPSVFGGIVCDESSILKNFGGKTRKEITSFMKPIPYRLLCTATAAPNDFHELGTSSEALGYLGYRDMLTRFFKEQTKKDYLGWGRKSYRFRGHASEPFWRWVCSWARACRKPSDLGFDDAGYVLPELIEREHVIQTAKSLPGMLFSTPARDLREQRQERRLTLEERSSYAVELAVNHREREPDHHASVIWCHLNDEADLIERSLDDAVQISGSMSVETKEERLLAFQDGEIKILVTKPKIGCYGLNWQHCNSVISYASHSYEQYYQQVRRCHRFGQDRSVEVHVIATEGEIGVVKNLQRKCQQADEMFDGLMRNITNAVEVHSDDNFTISEDIPTWL